MFFTLDPTPLLAAISINAGLLLFFWLCQKFPTRMVKP